MPFLILGCAEKKKLSLKHRLRSNLASNVKEQILLHHIATFKRNSTRNLGMPLVDLEWIWL